MLCGASSARAAAKDAPVIPVADAFDESAIDTSVHDEWFSGNIFKLRPLRLYATWCEDSKPFRRYFSFFEPPPAA